MLPPDIIEKLIVFFLPRNDVQDRILGHTRRMIVFPLSRLTIKVFKPYLTTRLFNDIGKSYLP